MTPNEQLIASAIIAAQRVYVTNRRWSRWAERWLSGRDRSLESALDAFIAADREYDRAFCAGEEERYTRAFCATWAARAAFASCPCTMADGALRYAAVVQEKFC